ELGIGAAVVRKQLPVAVAHCEARRNVMRLAGLCHGRIALAAEAPEDGRTLGHRPALQHGRKVDADAAGRRLYADDARDRRQEVDPMADRRLIAGASLHMAAPMEDQRLPDAALVETE